MHSSFFRDILLGLSLSCVRFSPQRVHYESAANAALIMPSSLNTSARRRSGLARPRNLFALALFVVAIVGSVWYRYQVTEMPAIAGFDGGSLHFWYCSQCRYEAVCLPGEETEYVPCPNCGLETRLEALYAPHSWKLWFLTAWQGWLAKAVLLGIGVLAALTLLTDRARAPSAKASDEGFIFTCKSCGFQLRSRRKEGPDRLICPRCKYVIADSRSLASTAPPDLEEDEELRMWWRQVRIKRRKWMD